MISAEQASIRINNIRSHIECMICSNEKEEWSQLACGHYMCSDCIEGNAKCPSCQQDIDKAYVTQPHALKTNIAELREDKKMIE